MTRSRRPLNFRANTVKALKDEPLRAAMSHATDLFMEKRNKAAALVDFESWRDQASAVRLEVLDNLSYYVDRFAINATRAGALVHRAADAASARQIVASVLKDRSIAKVIKAKSMVTEEIELNRHLEDLGIRVVETDLGEYIVQLAQEHPSHILAPALHKNRRQIGRLFADKLNCAYSDDPKVLTGIARAALRAEFLSAQAGVTGANFALADSGSLVLLTNEGNGRMATTLPSVHIAVLTIEKILPRMRDLPLFLRLLPRSASGQSMSSYVSVITGSRKKGEATGAGEMHIVLVDNGRSEIAAGEFREILKCIRCSACLNVCPVYRAVGGHAYESTYPGPMGIILTVLLEGLERAYPLIDASTLCGACSEVCPVKVPLVRLLYRLREKCVEEGLTSWAEQAGMAAFGAGVASSVLFSKAQSVLKILWPLLRRLGGGMILGRIPKPDGKPLRKRVL
jgi:L-lactate dehydrogenase complex protein LldF